MTGLLHTGPKLELIKGTLLAHVDAPLGPVHMVKKGHKYVTLLQINVPRVMILSQKLGNLFDKGTVI